MAKYKIIPSSRTIVQSPISIGHKAEKGVEAIEFDLTAWVEAYGSGTATIVMKRWGDSIPYPVALEIDENNKATWVPSDTDTAKAGMAYAQLSYIVGETVVKKSDIYTFSVMDSLTGEGEPPEAYESWLEHLTHLAAEAMAEVLDIEGIVTDKTLTVDGGIADAKATGDALALKADKSTTYTKTEVDTLIESVDVETDTTLSVSGAPADAAETGRQIGLLKADLANAGMSSAAKAALLACFRNVAWANAQGQMYYDDLVMALNNTTYPQIRASFNSGADVIYTDNALNSLKQYLTVKYYQTPQSAGVVVQPSNYDLSGTLIAGDSLITVSYNNLTTLVGIQNVVDYYDIWHWRWTSESAEPSVIDVINAAHDIDYVSDRSNVAIRIPSMAAYPRKTMVSTKGVRPITNTDTGQPSQYYWLPVPKTATSCTMLCDDNLYPAIGIMRLENGGYKFIGQSGWSSVLGSITYNFEPGENLYFLAIARHPDNVSYGPEFYEINFQ